jgi:hypothetical protein
VRGWTHRWPWDDRDRDVIGRRVAPYYDFVPKYDWAWVTEDIATGALPLTRREVNRLVRAGISHVITVCDEAPMRVRQVLCDDPRIEHLLNGETDDGRWKDAEWFAATLTFGLDALAKGGKVYVHCLLGSNRGPSHAYALLRARGFSAWAAEDAVRTARPRARLMYLQDAEAAIQAVL